jgi:hypothetical protein
MNPFDALVDGKTPEEKSAWLEGARGRAQLGKSPMPIQPTKRNDVPAPRFITRTEAPFDAPCECGQRYGMHRVFDYACPNQGWRPGNGQAQWLTRNWVRAD